MRAALWNMHVFPSTCIGCMLEQFMSVVADIEVVDKIETKGVSKEKDQDD